MKIIIIKNIILCKLISSFHETSRKMPNKLTKFLNKANFKFKWTNTGPQIAKSKTSVYGTGKAGKKDFTYQIAKHSKLNILTQGQNNHLTQGPEQRTLSNIQVALWMIGESRLFQKSEMRALLPTAHKISTTVLNI